MGICGGKFSGGGQEQGLLIIESHQPAPCDQHQKNNQQNRPPTSEDSPCSPTSSPNHRQTTASTAKVKTRPPQQQVSISKVYRKSLGARAITARTSAS
jgi:hypothetical protein